MAYFREGPTGRRRAHSTMDSGRVEGRRPRTATVHHAPSTSVAGPACKISVGTGVRAPQERLVRQRWTPSYVPHCTRKGEQVKMAEGTVRAKVAHHGDRLGTLVFLDERDGFARSERITCCPGCGRQLDLLTVLRRSD